MLAKRRVFVTRTVFRRGRKVDVDDLIDAHEAAQVVGLAQANSVHLYVRRYPSFPRPVAIVGKSRLRLWLRSEIQAWNNSRS